MRPIRDRLHRFNTIHYQIDDHLLQLDPIGQDDGQGWRQLDPPANMARGQFALNQRYDLINDAVDIERLFLRLGVLSQRADASDHFGRPVALLDNPFRSLACFVQIWSAPIEPAQAGSRGVDDRGERLVHFMRDRGCHFSQHCHPRDMGEFRLRLAQCPLGVISADRRSDIGAGAPIAEKISLCVEKRLAACPHVYRRSHHVEGVLEISKWLMGGKHRPMLPPFFGLRFNIRCNIPAKKAGQAGGLESDSTNVLRYADDPVVRRSLPEPIGARLSVITKALLALAKCLLSPLEVLDVGRRPIPFDNLARLIAQRLGLEQKPAIFTIEAPEPSFEPAWHTGLPYCAPLHQHALLIVRMKSTRPGSRGLVQ